MTVKESSNLLIQERTKELYDNTDFVHTIFEEMVGYAIIAADFDGNIIAYNEGARLIYGYAPEEVIGKQGIEIFFPREFIESGKLQQLINELIEKGCFSCDGEKVRKNGESFPAQILFTMTKDKYGKIVGLVEIVKDITEHKQAEEAQERFSQQLQAKVSELETFSYGIAHDLRSPLVSIEGFSRELRIDMLNHDAERVQEDIRLLESGVGKMQGFLNRTLEYSRSGQLMKRTKNVSFGKIVSEAIAEFNGQISSIGATVSLADKFPRVYADKMRIIQVLTNLIQNSIKYRDKTVPLKIEIGHRLSKGEVVFFVRDNGLGIDASDGEKVFALFYRGTADGEGSGIGLSIVKKIIEAHGGRIWVQQGESGKGTTLCFTLPKQSGTNKGDNNGKD